MTVLDVMNVSVVLGSLLLLGKLHLAGLKSGYRAFSFFLVLAAIQNGIGTTLNTKGEAYFYFWLFSEPIEWFVAAWVVLDVYSQVLQDYRGLYTVGRWLLMVAVTIALLASGLTLLIPSRSTGQGQLLACYYLAERAINFSLVVFLLTILLLLTRYPITLTRNVIVYSVVLSFFFLSYTAIYILVSTGGRSIISFAEYATQGANLAALATWLAMLSRAGEDRPQRLRPAWMPGREQELLNELNSLNAALLKVACI